MLSLVPGLAHLPLLDRDEPRFAQATYEMMERGDWIIPTFNDDYRFDKPPLTYWWMSLHYTMLGKREAGARFHSVLSSLFVGWLLFIVGTRWYSPAAGFWAAFGWLTSFQILIHGKLALADMPMVLCVALAQILIFLRLRAPDAPWKAGFWGLYISLALGFLAKGPIALFVPLLSLLMWRWIFWRKPALWKNLYMLRGTLVMLFIVGLWGIPALWITEGRFWEVGMGYHVVDRGLEVFHNRRFIPGIYFLTMFLSLLPWINRLPTLIRNLREKWGPDTSFLLCWLLSPFIIFSFYATQLPHYTLPGFPAFFLLLFSGAGHFRSEGKWELGIFRGLSLLWIGISIVGLVLLIYVGLMQTPDANQSLLLALFGGAMLPLILVYLSSAWSPSRVRRRSLFLGILALAVCLESTGRALRQVSPAVGLQNTVELSDREIRRVGYGYGEPSLIFYTSSGWEFAHHEEELSAIKGEEGPLIILALASEYKLEDYVKDVIRGDSREPRRDFRPELEGKSWLGFHRAEISGVNFARGAWIQLWVYTRDLPGEESFTPGPVLADGSLGLDLGF